MRWNEFFGVFVGAFLVLMGLFRSKVRSAYGSGVGINTLRARKNKENWDFTQKHAPKILVRYGMFMILVTLCLIVCCTWTSAYQ